MWDFHRPFLKNTEHPTQAVSRRNHADNFLMQWSHVRTASAVEELKDRLQHVCVEQRSRDSGNGQNAHLQLSRRRHWWAGHCAIRLQAVDADRSLRPHDHTGPARDEDRRLLKNTGDWNVDIPRPTYALWYADWWRVNDR